MIRIHFQQKENFLFEDDTQEVWKHYRQPLHNPEDRKGNRTFPGQIIGATDWLGKLWEQRNKIRDIPALLFWGIKDITFREKELQRWEKPLTHKKVIGISNSGHFPQEEASEQLIKTLKTFIGSAVPTEEEENDTYSS